VELQWIVLSKITSTESISIITLLTVEMILHSGMELNVSLVMIQNQFSTLLLVNA